MKMVISEYKLVAGLIDSEYRSKINKELMEKGKAKILIDYWMDGQSTPGHVTPFPFKISNKALAKRNELIYLTQFLFYFFLLTPLLHIPNFWLAIIHQEKQIRKPVFLLNPFLKYTRIKRQSQ